MPFKYACFISYSSTNTRLIDRFTQDLHTALKEAIVMRNRHCTVFLDRNEGSMTAGAHIDNALAKALCQSLCLVMVYTPSYFDIEHLYCAREYRGMELLEERRLAQVGLSSRAHGGLIIPVVLRGSEELPDAIKNERHYYNFESFTLRDVDMALHPVYEPQIEELARYICNWLEFFNEQATDPTAGCGTWTLPSKSEVVKWMLEDIKIKKHKPNPFFGSSGPTLTPPRPPPMVSPAG